MSQMERSVLDCDKDKRIVLPAARWAFGVEDALLEIKQSIRRPRDYFKANTHSQKPSVSRSCLFGLALQGYTIFEIQADTRRSLFQGKHHSQKPSVSCSLLFDLALQGYFIRNQTVHSQKLRFTLVSVCLCFAK